MTKGISIVKSCKLVPRFKKSIIHILKMNKSTNKFVINDEQLKRFSKLVVNSSYFKNLVIGINFFPNRV